MNVGRNDCCPCGSGKKYKRCCLKKDLGERHQRRLQQQQEQRAEELLQKSRSSELSDGPEDAFDAEPHDREGEPADARPSEGEGEPKPDPQTEALDARWDEFEAADYEGRIQWFIKTLDEPDLMDELAFEMLSLIRQDVDQPGERDQLEILIGALRERLPQVYADNAAYLLSWLIKDALADGRFDAVAPLAKAMGATAGRAIDMFNHVAGQLAYHGQLATLVEMMRTAWPLVKESEDILPWGVEEFVDRAVWFEALHYCEHAPRPRPNDPEAIKRLEFYTDSLSQEWLAELIELLTGQAGKDGTPGDAEPEEQEQPPKQRRKRQREQRQREQQQRRLYRLSVEFLRYAFREEGVPYAKAELAREKICDYLANRAEGELEPDDTFGPTPRRKKKSRFQHQPDGAALCPDRQTLDRYLARLFGIFGENMYEMAVLMELMPAWLRFLHRRELIDAEQHAATFAKLAELNADLLSYWEGRDHDPALYRGAQGAWQKLPAEAVARHG